MERAKLDVQRVHVRALLGVCARIAVSRATDFRSSFITSGASWAKTWTVYTKFDPDLAIELGCSENQDISAWEFLISSLPLPSRHRTHNRSLTRPRTNRNLTDSGQLEGQGGHLLTPWQQSKQQQHASSP